MAEKVNVTVALTRWQLNSPQAIVDMCFELMRDGYEVMMHGYRIDTPGPQQGQVKMDVTITDASGNKIGTSDGHLVIKYPTGDMESMTPQQFRARFA